MIVMFTSIVNDLGEVIEVLKKDEEPHRMRISCSYRPDSIDIGASIACSGICLTVVEHGRAGKGSFFAVDTAAESLRMTTAPGGAPSRPPCPLPGMRTRDPVSTPAGMRTLTVSVFGTTPLP